MSKNPVLHLRFNYQDGDRVIDSSGKGHHGTMHSGASIVHDETFGACVQLDGNDNGYVSVVQADDLNFANKSFTFEFWAKKENADSVGYIVTQGENTTNQGLHIGFRSANQFTFDFYNRIWNVTAPEDTQWHHWACVYDSDSGSRIIYKDGESMDQNNENEGHYQGSGDIFVGQSQGGSNSFGGQISHLYAYPRALSEAEIRQDMNTDLSAYSTFQRQNPLEFRLWNEDELELLFITDEPEGHPMTFDLINTSGSDIVIPVSEGTAGPDNFHFELRFRLHTLSQACKNRLNKQSFEGWSFHHQESASGYSLYWLSTETKTLSPDEAGRQTFALEGMGAEASGGARGTRVQLRYAGLNYAQDEADLSGQRMIQLDIVSRLGLQTIPLNFSIVGSNAILNDGVSKNDLQLRITNVMPDSAMQFNQDSKFVLSFEVQPEELERPWALAKTDETSNIEVNPDSPWTATRNDQSTSVVWEISSNGEVNIAAGDALKIQLNKIVSSLPTGETSLYIRYHNIPGYQDGYSVCAIQKTPVVTRASENSHELLGKVGIGTAAPQARLQIGDTVTHRHGHDFYGYPLVVSSLSHNGGNNPADPQSVLTLVREGVASEAYANMADFRIGRWQSDGTHSRTELRLRLTDQSFSPNEVLSIRSNGDVGIGTTNPRAKLNVQGSLRVDQGEIQLTEDDRGISFYGGGRLYKEYGNGLKIQPGLTVEGDLAVASGGNFHVASGNQVTGIPVIDFQEKRVLINERKGRFSFEENFAFSQPVEKAQAISASSFLRYEDNDHHIREILYELLSDVNGNNVKVNGQIRLRDNSDNRNWRGWVVVVVIAKLSSAI